MFCEFPRAMPDNKKKASMDKIEFVTIRTQIYLILIFFHRIAKAFRMFNDFFIHRIINSWSVQSLNETNSFENVTSLRVVAEWNTYDGDSTCFLRVLDSDSLSFERNNLLVKSIRKTKRFNQARVANEKTHRFGGNLSPKFCETRRK